MPDRVPRSQPEPAALGDPTRVAHIPRLPSAPTPRPRLQGALRGCPDPSPAAHSLTPRPRSSPCLPLARSLPALHSDSPAPGKVWWHRGRGQAARCSVAVGVPGERTEEAGPRRRSPRGGGQPGGREAGREAETRAPGPQCPRLLGSPRVGAASAGLPSFRL